MNCIRLLKAKPDYIPTKDDPPIALVQITTGMLWWREVIDDPDNGVWVWLKSKERWVRLVYEGK